MSDLPFYSPKADEFEAAAGLRDYFTRFADVQSSRRSMAERYAQVVEGMNLTCLGPWGYSYDSEVATFSDEQIPVIRNIAFSLVDTLTSKIGAIDPPLPTFVTSKGSWKDRRQAADLEELVRAEYVSPKGLFPNLQDLWVSGLKLAAGATGTVAIQFYADGDQVGARIHDTLDMAWSPDLRVQACVTWLPVEDVVEMYPDSEDDIRSCAGDAPPEWSTPTRNGEKLTDFCAVYEGWRGGSADKPGRYVVCVRNGGALKVADYPHKKPPFVWLGCSQHLYGPLAHSLIHHIYSEMRAGNHILARVDQAINQANESTVYLDQNKLVNPNAIAETGNRKIILTNEPYQPFVDEGAGFPPEHLNMAMAHFEGAHAISGLAESHTAGVRQAGVDSAIGQRYVAALVNERFASLQRRFVNAVAVESAELIVQILCEIFEENPKLLRLAPGQDTLKEISGAVALKGIEELKYVVQANAVSGSKGNPADRMQTALEMKQLGMLTDAQFAAMQGQGFDLPEELDDSDIDRQWLEKQMYRWQFASDEDVANPAFYKPPFEHGPIAQWLLQVVDGYLEADMNDLEPERLDFFFRFMADCAALAPAPAPEPPPAMPELAA